MSSLALFFVSLGGDEGFLNWTIGAGIFVFSIWMAVDCWQRGRDGWWVWVILVVQPLGGLVYFLQYWSGSRLEYGLWQRISLGGRVRELEARAHHLHTAAAFEQLGDLYRTLRKWPQAAEAYCEALKRDAGSLDAQAGLGYARLELGRPEEAWAMLGPIYQKCPSFDDDKLIRHLARCQAARGNLVDARNLYEYFLRKHTYTEAQVEYARVLLKADAVEAGRNVLQELIDDAQHAPRFARNRDRRWIREAKRPLSAIG